MKRSLKAGVALSVMAAVYGAQQGPAEAAGFALKEQSGSSLGQAFSNASTGTDDISHMFFNPAILAQQTKTQFVVVGSYVAPVAELSNASGDLSFLNPPGGPTSQDDISEDAVIPAFYAATPIMDGLVVGIGVNVPFGLVTEYDANWVGNFHAITSDLSTLNINPAVAWEIHPGISIGAGLQIQYIEAELSNQQAVPTGENGLVGTFARVDGDDWGVGFNVGALFEPTDDLTLGFGYRSEIDHTLSGTTTVAGIGVFGASADTTTPDMISGGFTYDIDDQWSVSGEVQYTLWSDFDELVVVTPALGTNTTDEKWNDQFFVAIGGAYKLNDSWTFRAGVAFDESPIPDATRTPRVPGADRYWLAVGASYNVNEWFGIDAGYSHIFVDDSKVRLDGTGNDATRGGVSGDYENSIDLFALQARFSF